VDVTFSAGNFADGFSSRDDANYDWIWDGANGGILADALTGTSGDTFDHVWDSDTPLPSATAWDIVVEVEFITSNASDLPGICANSKPGAVTAWHRAEILLGLFDNFNRIEPKRGLFDQASRTTAFTNQGNILGLTIVTGTDYFIRARRDGVNLTVEYGAVVDGIADSSTTFALTGAEQAELDGLGWGVFERRNGTRTAQYVVKRAAMGALNSLWS